MKPIRTRPLLTFAVVALVALALGPPGPAFAGHHIASCPNDREACLFEAIDELEPGAAGQWTKSGKPRVGALETITGIDLSGAERDRAWDGFAAWKAERAELERLEAALVSMTAERDALESEAATLAVAHDDLAVRLEEAERAIDSARSEAAGARRDAERAARRAAAAEAKTASLLGGARVCEAERAVVETDDSWRASSLRVKTNRLLRCLAVGER